MNNGTLASAGLDIWQPAMQQRVFRRLLDCFAYPGRVAGIEDTGRKALVAVLATLLDGEAALADPHGLLTPADWPKLEACAAGSESAQFVVADGSRAPDFTPPLGTLASPELGATLVLRVQTLGQGPVLHLTGPGISGETRLKVTGLAACWIAARAEWTSAFPLGVDIVLCDDSRIAALPRTTRVSIEDAAWAM